MSGPENILAALGSEIENYEEEVFSLFCHNLPSQSLGFIDKSATLLEVTIGNHDFLIHQSPTILSSDRGGGTTGAVIWKVSSLFATWISQTSNLLFRNAILNSKSSVLELGCGISGINALALRSLVEKYILTDQIYVMKLLNQNLEENCTTSPAQASNKKKMSKNFNNQKKNIKFSRPINYTSNISTITLDWEFDDITHKLGDVSQHQGFDLVLACDCIYNDALIQPFVNSCSDACKIRSQGNVTPTICIIAQQLRSSDVFESWLKSFGQNFIVWRIPDSELIEELRIGSGFVVHLGILKQTTFITNYKNRPK
ncbi:putative s-adenosyl-l-methionine-dependent methyltransferase [Erysiphe necator]|uniref:Putative s-adenosyl-l-methionine-dependent methyltransferase n=1 Tax=Uncinula necator TaxID=52586 RepID=A0A0B1PCU4_UNCNE|nr:putative s-adenosyl-l-methionine-dependent methyltransferase [Erysiphe necator]